MWLVIIKWSTFKHGRCVCFVLIWGDFQFKGYCVLFCAAVGVCLLSPDCDLKIHAFIYVPLSFIKEPLSVFTSCHFILYRCVQMKSILFPALKELQSDCTVLYSSSSGYCLFRICDPYCWTYCISRKCLTFILCISAKDRVQIIFW